MRNNIKLCRLLIASSFLFFSLFLTLSRVDAAVEICLISPIGSEMYRSGDTVSIEWKADNIPACAWSITFYWKYSGTSTLHYIGWEYYQNEGSHPFTIPAVSEESFIQIVARMTTDGGGICDSVTSNSMIILPADSLRTLNLLTPKPNSCDNNDVVLSAGDTYDITWDISGCQWNSLNLSIYYTTSFFAPFEWIRITSAFGMPCTSDSYSWTVPDVDSSNARIKIVWPGPSPEMEAGHIYPFTITPGPVNYCPVANAGVDQTVNEHEVVFLDGTDSYDPEGNSFYHFWEIVNPTGYYESQVTLYNENSSEASFVAPNVPVEITLDFRLTVTASPLYPCEGSPDDDIVTITIRPISPYISYFNPIEGWFKTPVTIFGENLGGSRAYLGGTEVSAGLIPLDSDDEFTFFVPDISLGSHLIEVGTDDAHPLFDVIDTPYQWQWGFQFHNPGGYDLSWSDYIRCFGRDAVTWELTCCDWDGIFCERACHNPIAQAIFDGYVEGMAQPGSCWGVSVASLNFLYDNFTLPFSGYDEVRDLVWNVAHPDVGITREIRGLHISQLSAEVISFLLDHLGDSPADHVARMMADTEHWRDKSNPDYTPGVISIQHITPGAFDNFAGHALIPDHVEEISPDEFRIYVYDSNREDLSTSLDNNNSAEYADITDFDNYPYITVTTSGSVDEWSFLMSGGDTWEASSGYNLTISIGSSEIDIPFYGLYYFPASVSVRDHYTFPTSLRGLGMILSGSADCGIIEGDGDRTGYDDTGKLNFEIADAIPIVPMTGGSFHEEELYWLPDNPYTVDIVGIKGGNEYNWKAVNGNTLFALNTSELSPGEKDQLLLGRGNSSLQMTTTEPLKTFSVEMVKTFTKNGSTYQRIFEVMGTQIDNKGKAWFRVTPDFNSLVYENASQNNTVFTARFIQTLLGPQPEPPDNQAPADINEQTLILQGITIDPGMGLKLTPEHWEKLGGSAADYHYYMSGALPDSAGDANYDGDLDGLDLDAFAMSYTAAVVEADLNMNGDVDVTDLKIFAEGFGRVVEP